MMELSVPMAAKRSYHRGAEDPARWSSRLHVFPFALFVTAGRRFADDGSCMFRAGRHVRLRLPVACCSRAGDHGRGGCRFAGTASARAGGKKDSPASSPPTRVGVSGAGRGCTFSAFPAQAPRPQPGFRNSTHSGSKRHHARITASRTGGAANCCGILTRTYDR